MLRKVGLPRTMPYFFASLKVAITLAFVGAVISETIASNDGIGYLMLQSASQFRVPLMFAGVFVIAAMGIATYVIFALLERRFTRLGDPPRADRISAAGSCCERLKTPSASPSPISRACGRRAPCWSARPSGTSSCAGTGCRRR